MILSSSCPINVVPSVESWTTSSGGFPILHATDLVFCPKGPDTGSQMSSQLELSLTFRRCPYVEGGAITLTVQAQTRQHTINARIVKGLTPFTLSAVMVVQLSSPCPDLRGNILLKLYDRRFAASYRETLGIDPWTPQVETQYQQFVRCGDASTFIPKLRSDTNCLDREGETWDAAQNESFLDYEMWSLYETETGVYRRAHSLQGQEIPRLFLHVRLTSPGFECPGILLQLVPGFSLADMVHHASNEHWQHIGEEAIRIVHAIGNLGILNKDVQRRSFLVNWDQLTNKFKVVMIDFALATFRDDVKSELGWRKLKAIQDEEGAVGYVLQDKHYPDFVYRRSGEYSQLDTDFKME